MHVTYGLRHKSPKLLRLIRVPLHLRLHVSRLHIDQFVEVLGLRHVLRQPEGGIGVLICESDSALLYLPESGRNAGRSRGPSGNSLPNTIHELKLELACSFDIFLG
jgi:hypothetical protein